MKIVKVYSFLIGSAFVLLIWLTVNLTQPPYDVSSPQEQPSDHIVLIDENIEDDEIQSDRNIYFIESHNSVFHNIDHRQACSIESAGEQIINVLITVNYLFLNFSYRLS